MQDEKEHCLVKLNAEAWQKLLIHLHIWMNLLNSLEKSHMVSIQAKKATSDADKHDR